MNSTILLRQLQRAGLDPFVLDLNGFEPRTITFLSHPEFKAEEFYLSFARSTTGRSWENVVVELEDSKRWTNARRTKSGGAMNRISPIAHRAYAVKRIKSDWDWKNYLQRGLNPQARKIMRMAPVTSIQFKDELHGTTSADYPYDLHSVTVHCRCETQTQRVPLKKLVICPVYMCLKCPWINTREGWFDVNVLNAAGRLTGKLSFPIADCPDVQKNTQRISGEHLNYSVTLFVPLSGFNIEILKQMEFPCEQRASYVGVFAPEGDISKLSKTMIRAWKQFQDMLQTRAHKYTVE